MCDIMSEQTAMRNNSTSSSLTRHTLASKTSKYELIKFYPSLVPVILARSLSRSYLRKSVSGTFLAFVFVEGIGDAPATLHFFLPFQELHMSQGTLWLQEHG